MRSESCSHLTGKPHRKLLKAINRMNKPSNSLQTPSHAWGKQKANLKAMFPDLKDGDFLYEYGGKEVMLDNLQNKIGITRSDLNELITDRKGKNKYYK
jgi:hypothetical protein